MPLAATSPAPKPVWREHHWWSNDGVRLHARVYEPIGEPTGVPILCLPGLTRNARDFDLLAPRLAALGRRVYAVDFRGRGDSGYAKDAMTYVPLTYVQDVVALLASEGIDQFAAIGTSLGGIVIMLLGATQPGRLVGAVLNDVGPDIEPAGLDRIRAYVGQSATYPTWVHAARALERQQQDVYPDWGIEDWLVMAKRTHELSPEGRIRLDYDSNIAQPFRVPGGESGVDLWPALHALANVPTLILRGELSDILGRATVDRMRADLAQAETVTVPRVGHAPTLDEAEALSAIETWLARLPA